MSLKTILVHLMDTRGAKSVLPLACDLARSHGAHLQGLHVLPPMPLAVGIDGGAYAAEILTTHRQRCEEDAELLRGEFNNTVRNQSFVAEWRTADATTGSIATKVAQMTRTADLAIVAQTADDTYFGATDVPERVAMESGRPVLIVPYAGETASAGKNILVAWNGRRESARAVFDALPFLKRADTVRILTVNSDHEERGIDVPAAEIGATLARHGVKLEVAQSVTAGVSVAGEILNRAADYSSDMLVMGCYGHSRMREFVFGGVTRHILANMTVPVLLSH